MVKAAADWWADVVASPHSFTKPTSYLVRPASFKISCSTAIHSCFVVGKHMVAQQQCVG